MRYYLLYPARVCKLVRGSPPDTLSYEAYNRETKKWEQDIDLWYKLEADSFMDFEVISEAEALKLIEEV